MIASRPADRSSCEIIGDKIDFLRDVQRIASGYDQYEPLMDDLLDRILSHDECRDYTIKKFEQMLDEIDWDCVVILQFCMHTLKWPTIKEKAAALLAVTDKINAERWYRHVLESFDDNWPDRDLWERYAPSDL